MHCFFICFIVIVLYYIILYYIILYALCLISSDADKICDSFDSNCISRCDEV
jgi:hypothetical protein